LSKRASTLFLAMFGGPILVLAALLGDFGESASAPIGGGGYDLSKPVYSALIFLLTALWSLIALVIALSRRDAAMRRRALILAGSGGAAFIASLILYGHNLT
jgi:hypothetical protein